LRHAARSEVAIKVLPDSFNKDRDRLQRFEREARALAALSHPAIAGIHGVEESNGLPVLVLELVEGPTLDIRLAQGALPCAEALDVARQIAGALEAAHAKGIVHRDLKPANIKLTADDRVKLLSAERGSTAGSSWRPATRSASAQRS
jgi:serine/threonine protein kinase